MGVCFVVVVVVFFFFSGSKNDPKNTKFQKKIGTFFAEKFWENILTSKFSAKIFQILVKKQLILQDFGKIKKKKKKSAKMENLGRCARKTFFFPNGRVGACCALYN